MRIADVSDSFRHWRTDTVRITVRLVWFLQGCVWSATLFVTQWRCCLIATMTIHGTGGKEYRCAKTCIRLVHVRSANEGILAAFQYIAASPRITFECCCRVFCKSNMVGSGPKKISGKTFKEVHLKSERDTLKGYIYIYPATGVPFLVSTSATSAAWPTFLAAFQGDSGSLPGDARCTLEHRGTCDALHWANQVLG